MTGASAALRVSGRVGGGSQAAAGGGIGTSCAEHKAAMAAGCCCCSIYGWLPMLHCQARRACAAEPTLHTCLVHLRPSLPLPHSGLDYYSARLAVPEEAFEINWVVSNGDGAFDNNFSQVRVGAFCSTAGLRCAGQDAAVCVVSRQGGLVLVLRLERLV